MSLIHATTDLVVKVASEMSLVHATTDLVSKVSYRWHNML